MIWRQLDRIAQSIAALHKELIDSGCHVAGGYEIIPIDAIARRLKREPAGVRMLIIANMRGIWARLPIGWTVSCNSSGDVKIKTRDYVEMRDPVDFGKLSNA